MKNLFFLFGLFGSFLVNASVTEKVWYACDPFKTDGHILMGVETPAVVSLPGDNTGGKALYVRTKVFSPEAQPRYHVLTKISQGVDNASYDSDEFRVDVFFAPGGMMAHIQNKNTQAYTNCKSPTRLRMED